MNDKQEWENLRSNFNVYLRWVLASFIDAIFISLWIITQWIVNTYVIKRLELSGIDQWQLNTFQLLFAIATLIPIASYVIKDSAVIIIRTWRAIRSEIYEKNNDQTEASRAQTANKNKL